ncbi:PH domain-containing protein [Silvimonas sp.]|uniref:PH domain-containing protein n=1 Tax=Silvimonas sp. TaxID=2650811 RepID=UPI00283C2E74|nr:PH domain-containing protein [Silvimonas sp.]MDR3429003.1 PH domain-containing protein [Silvimonas sp.]
MGTFVDNSLIPGEKVESYALVSWLSQTGLLIWAVLLVWTVVFPILFILMAIINVTTTELAVTNKKIVGKAGFIRRVSVDLPLAKLESVNIDQSLLGRMLGYGRVTIRGIGGNNVSIPYIKAPMDFRRVVMSIIDSPATATV